MAIQHVLTVVLDHFARSPLQSLGGFIAGLFLVYVALNEFVRSTARIKGLKGPPGIPLVGNLWDIRSNVPEKYRLWARKYGAVYQIQLGNIPVVVVNSADTAKALFSHHSQALSSRPEFYTFHKVDPLFKTQVRLPR
jgi:3-hydroxyphenylacetate 6-hydroxylase